VATALALAASDYSRTISYSVSITQVFGLILSKAMFSWKVDSVSETYLSDLTLPAYRGFKTDFSTTTTS